MTLRRASIADVSATAQALRLAVRGPRIGPCPACRAARSGRSDDRLPIGTTADARAWRCHAVGCDARGDALDLAAWALEGGRFRDLDRGQRGRVLAWIEPGTAQPVPIRGTRAGEGAVGLRRRPPPPAEVWDLWEGCPPVVDVPDAVAWLRGRALDPVLVADRDLARALEMGSPVPAWARYRGRPWTASGHRLLVALRDASGGIASLHARSVAMDAPPGEKAASPAGHTIRGLVMADGVARLLLAGAPPAWWQDGGSARTCDIVVAEGVPDWLTWATRWGDSADAPPAVLGVIAGAWTDDIAARLPDGARVAVRTHHDDAGHRYAAKIRTSIGARCRVIRAGGVA